MKNKKLQRKIEKKQRSKARRLQKQNKQNELYNELLAQNHVDQKEAEFIREALLYGASFDDD